MDEKGRERRDDNWAKGAGIRVPAPGESSSPGTSPPLDSPTIIDLPHRERRDDKWPQAAGIQADGIQAQAPSGRPSPPTPVDSPTIIDVPARQLGDIPARSGTPLRGGIPARNISAGSPTVVGAPATPRPTSGQINVFTGAPILETGAVLGARYQILNILGVGGMGAVYQALDLELNRTIALKVIRPDLAGNQSIIDRFKQELILATQVTHRNVVRIYDLGEAEGMKFITMEFVEGQDLRSLIHERSKLPPEEAVAVMQQVCRALEAAHAVGVIHRDLKPQNIMRDPNGRVVVMDFGLARTLGGDGMTQSGALVGTMEYMSPEQALAKELDQRSDIFSLGVIFYELLSGAIPFRADSALASLIKRTQERVVPVSDLDATIPAPISAIVSRCLERDVDARYQSASELLADLDAWQGKRPISQLSSVALPATALPKLDPKPEKDAVSPSAKPPYKLWLLAGSGVLALVLALAVGAYLIFRPGGNRGFAPAASQTPALTLTVVPMHNASGDPKLDWLGAYVADALGSDIGQSARLHTLPGDRVRQVLADLQLTPGEAIDPTTLGRVFQLTNTDIAVSGQYVRLGQQIQITAVVQDLKHDRSATVSATAANEQALPQAIDSLADQVRKSLSFSANQIDELKAQSFKPSSKSIDALRAYDQGIGFMRVGRNIDAAQAFQTAANADPQFALAYSALSRTQSELGRQADAEQSSQRASELAGSEGLPPLEKMLIDAGRAAILKDTRKAIGLYETLAQAMPGNFDVQYALSSLYSDTGAYDKARAILAKILEDDPKNVLALWRSGVVELQSGRFQNALDPLSKAEYLTNASGNQEHHAVVLLAVGIAYQFLQKNDQALRYFGDSIAISEKLGQKRAVAAALVATAQVQVALGKPDAALDNLKKAVALFQTIGSNKEAGDAFIDMATIYQNRGDNDQALQLYRDALQIERDAGDLDRQANCLNNIGYLDLARADTESAFTYFQQGLQLGEKIGAPQRIADPLQGLGEAYTMTGQFDEALAALQRALDTWRGNGDAYGIAATQRQMGVVYGYQARFGAAVQSLQQSVKGFDALGDKSSVPAAALQNLAQVLARAGRGDEAAPYIDQAETLARNLRDPSLLAKALGTKGQIAFYRGDLAQASTSFQLALQSATKGTDRDALVEAKLDLGRLATAQGHAGDAVNRLRPLTGAGVTPDRDLALQCSVAYAEALIAAKDYAKARQVLQEASTPTEKSGMRLRLARIYYYEATASRLGGNSADAWNQYRQSLALLNAVRNEPGAENILRRVDLKTIFDECTRWVGAGSGQASR
jgi:tetratricopeptide (TPR) repeat protein/predicted Ser/Thr protein kinase